MAMPTIEATQTAIASALLFLIFDESAASTIVATGAMTIAAIWVAGLKPPFANANDSRHRPTTSAAFTAKVEQRTALTS